MRLQDYLIGQSVKPNGPIGKIMLGIENIDVKENCKLLDLGFGGGKLLKILSKKI